jgi:hypothetical protein
MMGWAAVKHAQKEAGRGLTKLKGHVERGPVHLPCFDSEMKRPEHKKARNKT